MQELKAGVTDADVEKHVPVYTVEGSHVHVVVGETKHPMLEEHFIEWITLNTNQGIYRKQLNPVNETTGEQVGNGIHYRENSCDISVIRIRPVKFRSNEVFPG